MRTSKVNNRWALLSALGLSFLLSLPPSTAIAGEGMYLLDKPPEEGLKRSRLKIPAARLSALAPAIVQVARGGTGSFVSSSGLVVTNHHVAFGCLARLNVQPEHKGIMDAGYVAKDRASELPCPGYDMLTVIKVEEVSTKVLGGVPAGTRKNYAARFKLLRKNKEKLRKACEADGKHICQVAEMNGGVAYYLSTYKRIRDVRLVYSPPKSMGKYGGDIDNWMFPRHTADFAFLRAYVDGEGKGAPHAEKNKPMATPVHLRISPYGVKKGSLVLVMGFPGRTKRHATSSSVSYQTEHYLPEVLGLLEDLLGAVNVRRKASKEANAKYMTLESRLQNALKYYRMSKKGFDRWKVLERKQRAEKALLAKLPPAKAEEARKLLKDMAGVFKGYIRFHKKHKALSWLTWAVPSVRVANHIARWAVEKEKPDEERKDESYKDKNIYRITEAAGRVEKETELASEKALLAFFLRRTSKLPRKQQPGVLKKLDAIVKAELRRAKAGGKKLAGDKYQQAVELLYGRTLLLAADGSEAAIKKAKAYRTKLLGMKAAELAKVDDPLIVFARALEQELREIREGPFKLVEQYLGTVLAPRWVKEFLNPPYPDANFTVRLSYGSVQDYTSADSGKTHRYVTGLAGLLKKETGKWPFIVPDWLKDAAKDAAKSPHADPNIKDIPIDFTCTLDTTGGNSGSAVLDDRGRLVGLLFDGTPESVLSDWQYLQKEQRSIVMDIRVARYMAQLQGAEALLQEITPPSPAEVRKLRKKLQK